MKKALLAVAALFIAFEKAVLLGSLGGMILSMAIAILSRPVGVDVPWVTPLVLALMIVSTFAGAALATATRRHITMDLLNKALGPKARAAVSALTSIIGAGVSGWLALVGKTWVAGNIEFAESISSALKLPDWWLQAVVPIGFFLFALHCVVNFLLDVGGLISGDLSHLPDPNSQAAHGVTL